MFNKDIKEIENLEKDMEEYNKCNSELSKKRFLLKITKSNLEMVKRHEKSDKRDTIALVGLGIFALLLYLFAFDDIKISINMICLSVLTITLNNVIRNRTITKNRHSNDLIKLGTLVKKLEAEIKDLEDKDI